MLTHTLYLVDIISDSDIISSMKEQKAILFVDYLAVITKRRKFIIRNVIIITILAIIISLLLMKEYTATAAILPPGTEQNTMLGIMTGGLSGGLTNIGGMMAGLPGLSTPSDLYAAILGSGRIKSEIIKKYDLKKEFKAKTMHDTNKKLTSITKITVRPEGIVSVGVTYHNKHLAADIANSYIEELDKFNTETAMTLGKRYRIFIEERLDENSDSLATAEEALRNFQEKHHTIALDVEIENAIAIIAELKSQIILLEVKKGALTSSSQYDNPYLHTINRELRESKKQLKKIEIGSKEKNKNEFGVGFSVPFSELPEVSLEYVRLFRDVEVQEKIFELLTQQYEQAKIMELKDTPTVQFLDRAYPPEKRSFPNRRNIVVLSAFMSLIFSVIFVFTLEYMNKLQQNTQLYTKWQRIVNELRKDCDYFREKIWKIFKPQKSQKKS